MSRQVRLSLTVVLTALTWATGWADEASDVSSLKSLVRQLGSASFFEREEASRLLSEAGPVAIPVLREAVDDENLEIRYRARRVIDTIEELDLERRLQSFLDSKTTPPDDALPGWGRYRKVIGEDRTARELFVEMHRSERRLFQLVERGEKHASDEFRKRCVELQSSYTYVRRLPTGSVAAMLFLGSDPKLEQDDATLNRLSSFCNYNDFRQQITSGAKVAVLRKVLGAWVSQPSNNTNHLYSRILLAIRFNVREGVVPARAMLQQGRLDTRSQYAMLALGKFGDRKTDLPTVKKFFGNATQLYKRTSRGKTLYICQARDVALAVAIHMTGQKTNEYPFAQLRTHPQYLFSVNSPGFADDAKRGEAFTRFADWEKSQRADDSGTE